MVEERLVRVGNGIPSTDPDPEVNRAFAARCETGVAIRDELLHVVHGEAPAHSIDQREMKNWIKRANRVLARTADKKQHTIWLGELALESGMTGEQFARACADEVGRELEQWAAEHEMTPDEARAAIDAMPPHERPFLGGVMRHVHEREGAMRNAAIRAAFGDARA
jgi:hypothetical protein